MRTHKTTNLELKGKRFGKLRVIEQMPERISGHVMWRCICDCGVETIVRGASLPTGNTNSCGCLKTTVKKLNKYGKLRAMERIKTEDGWKWRCLCDCGTETFVMAGNLISGNTQSCGCLQPINEEIPITKRKQKRTLLVEPDEISYSTWRKHVRRRDNDTCAICKYVHQEPYDMVVHHKDSFEWCVNRRTDISNGITLCRWCHYEFHDQYGVQKNTEQQFKTFYLHKTGTPYTEKPYAYLRYMRIPNDSLKDAVGS